MRRIALAIVALAIMTAACGGGDSDGADGAASSADDAAATATSSVATTAAAPASTAAPDTAAPDTAADEQSGTIDGGASAVEVNLVEWAIEAPTQLPAGTVEFAMVNGGDVPHQLTVIRADSYASLPVNARGTVLVDELEPGQLVAANEPFLGGESASMTVELEPGSYVLVCNIEVGPSSHAGNGQVLDVTVG